MGAHDNKWDARWNAREERHLQRQMRDGVKDVEERGEWFQCVGAGSSM
ncbi:hypothetical protein [Corallococcus sp. EGB]|nr:hypothetical protein [Corallococcus sp. EGB]